MKVDKKKFKHVIDHRGILSVLCNPKTKSFVCKKICKADKYNLFDCLCEISKNILKGNVKFTEEELKKLKSQVHLLTLLSHNTIPRSEKHRLFMQFGVNPKHQSGGKKFFKNAMLPVLQKLGKALGPLVGLPGFLFEKKTHNQKGGNFLDVLGKDRIV